MQFWKLGGTNFVSDYKTSFVNGKIDHPYSLPGVMCEKCGQSMGEDHLLPYECPEALREKFSDPAEVSIGEFERISQPVRGAVANLGVDATDVQPGSSILPIYLDVPSKPEADFLWPSFSPLVTPRIRESIESLNVSKIAFAEVTPRKIGKKSAKLEPPIPSSGEPEDMVEEVPVSMFPKTANTYFELCVYGRSKPPPGRDVRSTCPACGDRTFSYTRGKPLVMTEAMWTGLDIFILDTTAIILVSDRVKQTLQKLRPTNVEFTLFPSG